MRWSLIAALLAVSPVMVAYSGTFVDDFNDRDLDGWHIETGPGPPFPNIVKLENGYVVMDASDWERAHGATLELIAHNAKEWDSYTLTCRVRFMFMDVRPGAATPAFVILVRYREGAKVRKGRHTFTLAHFQEMGIWLFNQSIWVFTSRPHERPHDEGVHDPAVAIDRAKISLEHLGQPIEQNRWYPVKIVAKKDDFEFYFDDNLLVEYEDRKAVPGTVEFDASSGLLAHLDDIAITGPRIPNIGGPHRVDAEARLATTWGEIKNSPRR